MSGLVDLAALLLPDTMTDEELEAEARKVYFGDLAKSPGIAMGAPWAVNLHITFGSSEGSFQHAFGESEGWASYRHHKTGQLDRERLRRVHWIRPVLEFRAKGTKIYVNNHSMKGEHEKKRLYVVTQTGVLYMLATKYLTNDRLVFCSAFPPNGPWLRQTLKKNGTVLLGPV